MHFTPLAVFATFAAAVIAQSKENPFIIDGSIQITAGKPYTIKWNPTTQGPVSLSLRNGASSNLNQPIPIAASIPNSGSYEFTLPPDTTRNSDYTLQINPVGKPEQANYTPQFVVESSNTVASQSNSASASASGSTATMSTSGKSSATTSGSTSTGTNTRSTTSGSSSASTPASTTTMTAAATTAEAAPTGAAAANNVYKAQGGMIALMVGAAALL